MTELLTYSSRGSFRKLHTIGKASQWESQFLQQSPNSNIHELQSTPGSFYLWPEASPTPPRSGKRDRPFPPRRPVYCGSFPPAAVDDAVAR